MTCALPAAPLPLVAGLCAALLPPEAGGMLSRPLIYTALTRAQRHLSVVHAAGPAVARAVRQVGTLPRRTQLRALLAGESDSG